MVGARPDSPNKESREQQLSLALRQAGVAAFDWDVLARKITWSGCHEEMFGVPCEQHSEQLYDQMLSFVHPDDVVWVDRFSRDFVAGGEDSYTHDYRIVRPDGEVRWVSGTGALQRDRNGAPVRVLGVVRDITADRRGQRQRARSLQALDRILRNDSELESLLDILYTTAPVGLAFLDVDLRFARVNEKLAEINGIRPERHIGRTMGELFGEPGRAIEAILTRVLSTGEPQLDVTLPIPHHSQPHVTRLYTASYYPVRDRSGDTLGVGIVVAELASGSQPPESLTVHAVQAADEAVSDALASGHDWRLVELWREVADRRQVAASLRKSEERFRLATHAGGLGVFEWHLWDDSATWQNERMFELFGHAPTDPPVSRTEFFARYIVPQDIESYTTAITVAVQERQPFRTVARIVGKDGVLRWLEYTGEFEYGPDGAPLRMVGVATDVSQRERAKEGLVRLQALTDAALAKMDIDALLAELLARVRQLLGTDSASVLLLSPNGATLSVAKGDGLLAEEQDAVVSVGRGFSGRIAATAAPLVCEDTRRADIVSHALRHRLTSLVGVPLVVEGRLIGVLHTGTAGHRQFGDEDISLLQAAADRAALAIEHARLYAEAQSLIAQLQASNAVKDELLGLVSHELRTPLTTMMGGIDLLAQRFDALDGPSREEAFTQLRNDALRLKRVVQNMLILARGDSVWETDPEPVMLHHLLRQFVDSEQARDGGRPLLLAAPGSLPPVLASVGYLEQILENLLTNARKYGSPGTPIEIAADHDGDRVTVTVADRGAILREDEVGQFFEPFYRSQHVKGRSGGIGLGMSVCRRLVEVLGGTIAARPREGGGLVVAFSLPVMDLEEVST